MYAKVESLGLNGLDAFSVTVEADISTGLPRFDIVGLPDMAVRESRERVRATIKNVSSAPHPALHPHRQDAPSLQWLLHRGHLPQPVEK